MGETKPYIYVVDDDESVCRALQRLMKSAGFGVETFSSAQSFLDSVPTDTKGCLILDMCMPGIDGFELQRRLNDRRSLLHIIFITAHAQAGDRERAMKRGAIGFLQKPFDDQSLLDLINSIAECEE